MLIVQWEINFASTSTRHQKNWDVAPDSCFSLFGARQYCVTARENSGTSAWVQSAIIVFDP